MSLYFKGKSNPTFQLDYADRNLKMLHCSQKNYSIILHFLTRTCSIYLKEQLHLNLAVTEIVYATVTTNLKAPDGLIFMRKSTEYQKNRKQHFLPNCLKAVIPLALHFAGFYSCYLTDRHEKAQKSAKLSP